MKKTLFSLFIFISIMLQAQDFEIGMNVTKSDLSISSFDDDPSSPAIMIYDYGKAYFNKQTWRLNVELKQKFKILTKEALEKGKKEIPLYIGKNSKETIKDIQVRVHNIVDDKIVVSTMSKDAIYTEENENYNVVRLIFPNVQVGSVITVSYTKSTPFVSKFQPWYFQLDIPSLHSEFNASIPGNYEYNIKLVGTIPLKENSNRIEYNCLEASSGAYANCAVYKYVMTDIPAYKKEKYTTTAENYTSRIEYELSVIRKFNGEVDKITKSWSDVDSELKSDSDFGRQINKKKIVKDLISSNISSISDNLEKAKAIYQYLLDNYKWNGESGRHDVSIRRLLEEGGGNAFEINLLLQNLLHSEGFDSYPMLLSTRDNGLATKIYPVISDFNYVIVKLDINDKTYYLDATNPYLAFGEIPFYCLNQYGRVYDIEYASYWEDIIPNEYSTTQIGAKFKLDSDNRMKGTVSFNTTGYNSHSKKKFYFENPSAYLEKLKSSYINSSIENHSVTSKSKNDKTFSESLKLLYDEPFTDGKIFFNPFIYKFYEENPFKLQQRTYPVDFGYKQAFLFTLEIDLGDNLKVLELPKKSSFALPNKSGLVTFSSKADNKKLSVFVRIKLDKAIYDVGYYDALKTYMSKIIDLQNNTLIVLEKK